MTISLYDSEADSVFSPSSSFATMPGSFPAAVSMALAYCPGLTIKAASTPKRMTAGITEVPVSLSK